MATLALRAPEAGRSDVGWPTPGTDLLFDVLGPDHQRIAVGRVAIGIGHQRSDGYESIVIAKQGELLDLMAQTAWLGPDETRAHDRAQLRSDSAIVPSPDGSRFLIASRGTEGALQLWCTPTDSLGEFPPEPPRPAVMEQNGITEIAMPDFPVVVYDAVEIAGGVLMLGVEPHPPQVLDSKRGLWTYAPATRKLARVALPVVPGEAAAVAAATTMSGAPPAEPEVWQRFELAPGGAVWLIGKRHVAHRAADGAWIVHSLPEGTTNQIAIIDDALAVHVGIHPCRARDRGPRRRPGMCSTSRWSARAGDGGAPARTSNEWVGTLAPFAGGFVALGGAEIGFRDGRWVGPRDPLVVTAAKHSRRKASGAPTRCTCTSRTPTASTCMGSGTGASAAASSCPTRAASHRWARRLATARRCGSRVPAARARSWTSTRAARRPSRGNAASPSGWRARRSAPAAARPRSGGTAATR